MTPNKIVRNIFEANSFPSIVISLRYITGSGIAGSNSIHIFVAFEMKVSVCPQLQLLPVLSTITSRLKCLLLYTFTNSRK